MNKRTLGPDGPEVSAIGLGCMGMSAFYGATDEQEALRTIHRALELGCNFLDTSDMYGPHTNERLVGRAIEGRREEVFLATKFGIKLEPGDRRAARRSIDGSPEYVREACEARCSAWAWSTSTSTTSTASTRTRRSRRRWARWPSWWRRARCATSGSRRPSARDDPPRARRAPDHGGADRVLAVDARRRGGDPADAGGAGDRAGRLLAARAAASCRGASARRRSSTRATSAATGRASPARTCEQNLSSPGACSELAAEKGITPGQLALAWVLHRGEHIVPIPGTKRVSYLEENLAAADVELSDEEVERIAEAVPAAARRALRRGGHALGQHLSVARAARLWRRAGAPAAAQ